MKNTATTSARRAYHGYWDKVVTRRGGRNFTGQGATV